MALQLIGPGVLGILALGFLWAWIFERKRHYLLLLCGGYTSLVLGALTQILAWPVDTGINAIISNTFYIVAVLAVSDGVLRRSEKRFGTLYGVLLLLLFSALIWYFSYVDRDLLMRIYIQNFGIGAILLYTALRLRSLTRRQLVDKMLFWTLVLCGLQFFARTVLTAEPGLAGVIDFGETLFWRSLQFSLAVMGTAFAFVILAAAISDVVEGLRRERDFDRLTGILNRRGFEERADISLSQTNDRLALILCDLDHFKEVNDSFGHAVGDDVLCAFGGVLRRTVRECGLVGRVGGEEFAILLAVSDVFEAQEFVRRLQSAISAAVFPLPVGRAPLTASIGVAVSRPAEDRASLFKRADVALYDAKNSGRDRVAFSAE